jgi:hypothetical protein
MGLKNLSGMINQQTAERGTQITRIAEGLVGGRHETQIPRTATHPSAVPSQPGYGGMLPFALVSVNQSPTPGDALRVV